MDRRRLLLVPALTELEWTIRSQLERWAQVASFDVPGVGSEPPPPRFDLAAMVRRGVEEVQRLAWPDCVVVGDEFGSVTAVHIAAALPVPVVGLALGHACISFDRHDPRPALNAEVVHTFGRMLEVDYRTYARHFTQMTRSAYDDELADRFLARVPHEIARSYKGVWLREAGPLRELIEQVGAPLLLAKHEDCLGFTDDGFAAAVAAFPQAEAISCGVKPSASGDFAEALARFCAGPVANRLSAG